MEGYSSYHLCDGCLDSKRLVCCWVVLFVVMLVSRFSTCFLLVLPTWLAGWLKGVPDYLAICGVGPCFVDHLVQS